MNKRRRRDDVSKETSSSPLAQLGPHSETKKQAAAVNRGIDPTSDANNRHLQLDRERKQLPIWSARDKIIELVRRSQTVVLIGETGSGKTTQLPRFLFEAGLARGGAIACTQPRRVAAMTVAKRVAEEMHTKLGEQVGYSVRFDDTSSPRTRIKYLTDGMLLREALLDPLLKKYKVVVLDEAHDRTVHTDVLFGLLKQVQVERGDDFRVVVMSATLDAAKFVDYFHGAQAGYIQGRQFPVRVYYTATPEDNYLDAALVSVLQLHCDEPLGDILVFLTGQEEIESLQRLIKDRLSQLPADSAPYGMVLCPLYAALPPDQQNKVFETTPPNTRKVILATNIAETSITIQGVRYVIDTGFVKARNYNAKLGADSLQVVPISQAQARQRSGRAGREGPGKAFRLFTESSFQQLSGSMAPEIQRINLSSVVLQLKALGVDDLLGFDFMDPPPRAAVIRSLELLYALGALDPQGKLTDPLGVNLSRLPVEPMYGKVLLVAGSLGCAAEALSVTAMVSTDPVFYNPRESRDEVSTARNRFLSVEGDHITLLRVFKEYVELPVQERGRWCREHFISARSMSKALDIHHQLKQHLVALKIPIQSCLEDTAILRRAIVSGLFPNAAQMQPDGSYRVISSGQTVALHPSSVLCGKRAPCIVFNELLLTTRHYAKDVCRVEPHWLPEVAPAFFATKAVAGGLTQ